MKHKILVLICVITALVMIFCILSIENNRKSPMARYLETTKEESLNTDNKYLSNRVIYNDTRTLQYEFLSYDLIDDKDIAKQTDYKAKFFIEGQIPDADYSIEYTDYETMRKEHPKIDEYIKSNGEKGMTEAEYREFIDKHISEYTTRKHLKAKYLFLKCKITYLGINPGFKDNMDEYLNVYSVFAIRDGKLVGDGNDFCYFDHPQNTEGSDREYFFDYEFNKAGDTLDCVIGIRLTEDRIDFSEGTSYYVGFDTSSDNAQFNPAIDDRCVALESLPKVSET